MNWGAILNGIWWWDDRGGEGLQCGIAVAAGGDGMSDYQINLDPGGGLITLACQPQSVVDKFEIMYSPPDLVSVRKRNEFIINKSNPEVFKKSINLSLDIDVFSVSFITDLNEFIFGKKSLNNSLT